MEMISPKTYIMKFENCSIEELNKEKEELSKTISELERTTRHPEDTFVPYYDNDTKLSVYKDYLKELENLINSYGDNK